MVRTWQFSLGVVLVLTAACHHAPAKAMRTLPMAARAGMDSAEIDRLCLAPDSVRAGKADCVLKDQSAPLQRLPQPPSAPPR
jgi:hypothetical protein